MAPLLVTNNEPKVVGRITEIAKLLDYNNYLQLCEQGGFGFRAFGCFGEMVEKSRGLLRRIFTRLVHFRGCPSCLRRVSFTVKLGVAGQFIACRLLLT